ncbi:MAG: hypothetical protein ACQETR_11360 [Thermodesulfobacteriota bacterium]
MKHYASSKFWKCFYSLSPEIQKLARKNYKLLKENPNHPSLHFKLVFNGRFRTVRIGIHYRALGVPIPEGVQWLWIGNHAEYDRLLG